MTNIFRNGALALGLLAGAALVSASAMADYKDDRGSSWNKGKGSYKDGYRKHNRSADGYYAPRSYRGPGYAYGPRYDSYGPSSGPGLSITIR